MLVIETSGKNSRSSKAILVFYLSSFKKSIPFIILFCRGNEHSAISIRTLVSVKSAYEKNPKLHYFSSYLFHISGHFDKLQVSLKGWYSFNPVWMTFQSQVNTQHSCTLKFAIRTSTRIFSEEDQGIQLADKGGLT